MCRVARFYGWTPEVIDEMDTDTFRMYSQGLVQVEAQELLAITEAIAYPHYKKDADRNKYVQRLRKFANPPRPKKAMSMEELKEFLSGR